MRRTPWLGLVGLLSFACSESGGSDTDAGMAGSAGTAGVLSGSSGAAGAGTGGGGATGGGSGGSAGSGNAGSSAGGSGTGGAAGAFAGGAGTAGTGGGSSGGSAGSEGGAGGAGAVSGGASGSAGVAGTSGSAGDAGSGGASGSAGAGGSAGGSGCDPSLAETNRALVGDAIDELFIDKDVSAIDRYWSDPYLQHNPIAQSGVATFRSIMSSFVTQPSFSYTRLRTLAECDLVVVQGRYSQTGVIFDMFRVDDGKIMEHWDSDSGQASETDGPTAITPGAPTADNRVLVESFLAALIAGELERAPEFLAASHTEHHGGGGDGPGAFTGFLEDDDVSYAEVHHVIADGDFVFTMSEASVGGDDYALYDLFRLDGGAIVEHWDSRRVVPNSTASGLPIF